MTRTAIPSRVLVTGAGGAIGRGCVQRLLDEDVEVVALSMDDGFRPPHPARAVIADAADETAMESALIGCDAVVHLAALAHPSLGTPRQVFTNNVVSTFTVLSAAARMGAGRAVIASSINAYGVPMNPHHPLPAYFPLDEALPVDAADAYSLSKHVDELSAAVAARAWDLDVVALRFPLVKGVAELHLIAADVSRDPASMMRTGWGYLTIDDAARAISAGLRAPLTGAHVIGLSAADSLLRVPSEELLDRYAPAVPRRAVFTGFDAMIDTGRARAVLGFEPGESMHDHDPGPR